MKGALPFNFALGCSTNLSSELIWIINPGARCKPFVGALRRPRDIRPPMDGFKARPERKYLAPAGGTMLREVMSLIYTSFQISYIRSSLQAMLGANGDITLHQ